jgi:16S rRNA (guanine966-N2)-methyltransferase
MENFSFEKAYGGSVFTFFELEHDEETTEEDDEFES